MDTAAEAGAPSGANPAHSRTWPPLSEAMPGSLLHLSLNSVHVPSLSPRKTPFAPTLCRGESRRILSTSSIHRLSNFKRNRTHAPLARGWLGASHRHGDNTRMRLAQQAALREGW